MPESANKAVFKLPAELRVLQGLPLKDKLKGIFSPVAQQNVLPYTVLYNPIIGGIEPPVCEHCGRPAIRLVPASGGFVCENCLREVENLKSRISLE